MSERDDAIKLANIILDRPYADPDDDLAILSRNLLRSIEANERLRSRIARYEEALKWYADKGRYAERCIDTLGFFDPNEWQCETEILEDGGEKARQALGDGGACEQDEGET